MEGYIALDVGGTQVKSAILAQDGRVLAPIRMDPARANEKAPAILRGLGEIIQGQRGALQAAGRTPAGIGVAFPGPFDYENGVSRIRGIGKYDALYGVDVKGALAEGCGLLKEDFVFINDADLFCLGECAFGKGRGARRAMLVCIGTGLGSGFVRDGKLVKSGGAVPENGWIYAEPYRDGILDGYLSATGLSRLLRGKGFAPGTTVKDAAALARAGNENASAVFREFGRMLAEALPPIARRFGAECLIIGGQVAKSADLFCGELREALAQAGIDTRVSEDSSLSALRAVPLLFAGKPPRGGEDA